MEKQPNKQPNKKKGNTTLVKPFTPPVKKEIPMYDPHTGEPNPLYEELTGRKNPLVELRKNKMFNPTPHVFEPKRKNRWIVNFPEKFKIESWTVSKTQRPSIKIVEKRFLGIKYKTEVVYDKISFEFIDPINPSLSEKLAIISENINQTFDYTLEMLDPTGVCVERWMIEGCKIEAISFGALGYDDDGIAKCFMLVKPSKAFLIQP